MNRKTIWNEKQNKASYIVDDIVKAGYLAWLDDGVAYEILLRRGVFKWFAARRQLIKLKDAWRDRITDSLQKTWNAKHYLRDKEIAAYWKGYRSALEECRAEIREICHSDRWQAPDNDRRAKKWLEEYEGLERQK